jgi:hypothetical protein
MVGDSNPGVRSNAAADPAVHQQVIEVQHLIRPRSVLRDPNLVQRVQMVMAET